MTTMYAPIIEGPTLPFRYDVQAYHALLSTGVIEEGAPYELLDGQIVRKLRNAMGEDPMTIGYEHVGCVQKLARLNGKLSKRGCHLRIQQPIAIPPFNVPEPDGAIVTGDVEFYISAKRHPEEREILCLIEVADASLSRDRGYKLRCYADAGVVMYVIVNLPERVAELYTEPVQGAGRYGRSVTLRGKEKLTLPTVEGSGVVVSVSSLLP